MNIAIIGAGIAGLTVASKLKDTHQITVFDKARGVGGRMTHRQIQDFDFDHGAQYITIRNQQFADFIHPLIADGQLQPWSARFISIEQGQATQQKQWQDDHLVGVPAMNQLCKTLAKECQIKLRCKVTELVQGDKGWLLVDENQTPLGEFDFVITTAPAQQTLMLTPSECCYYRKLQQIKMVGCFTLMMGFDEAPNLDFDAAYVQDELLSWISVNHSKPGRQTKPSLVINSTNRFAEQHLDDDLEVIKQQLFERTKSILSLPQLTPCHLNLHRWRYANIGPQQGPLAFIDDKLNLAACGDWCIKGRVESAFLSASSLAEQLM